MHISQPEGDLRAERESGHELIQKVSATDNHLTKIDQFSAIVSNWVYKVQGNGTPGSAIDGLNKVYLKVFLKMLSQCIVLELLTLYFVYYGF